MSAPTVLGVDLSLTGTGVSDGTSTWLVASRGKAGDSLALRAQRLDGIRSAVLAHTVDGDLVVIEQPAYSRQTGHMHDRSGLWWLLVTDLLRQGLLVAEVAPSALKRYATGRGNSPKSAVTDATARRYADVDTGGGDDNRCDALWLSRMGLDYLGHGSAVPESHRAALASVRWPAAGVAAGAA